jgi:hypothetical protein
MVARRRCLRAVDWERLPLIVGRLSECRTERTTLTRYWFRSVRRRPETNSRPRVKVGPVSMTIAGGGVPAREAESPADTGRIATSFEERGLPRRGPMLPQPAQQ